jgi:hypothetical protein
MNRMNKRLSIRIKRPGLKDIWGRSAPPEWVHDTYIWGSIHQRTPDTMDLTVRPNIVLTRDHLLEWDNRRWKSADAPQIKNPQEILYHLKIALQ